MSRLTHQGCALTRSYVEYAGKPRGKLSHCSDFHPRCTIPCLAYGSAVTNTGLPTRPVFVLNKRTYMEVVHTNTQTRTGMNCAMSLSYDALSLALISDSAFLQLSIVPRMVMVLSMLKAVRSFSLREEGGGRFRS